MSIKSYAKSLVYGGLDGIVTTFAVIAGSIGGNLGTKAIIVLGFSNLLADGFSMACGDYLSSTTEEETGTRQALANASMTFLAFNLFGLIPLFSYLVANQFGDTASFPIAIFLVSLALVVLGQVKASITDQPKLKEISRTLLVGLLAALVAYFVGKLLGQVFQ